MQIVVHARARAKTEKVEAVPGSAGVFKVWVKEPAVDGKANVAIAKALAAYFDVPRARVVLVSGTSARIKRFSILA